MENFIYFFNRCLRLFCSLFLIASLTFFLMKMLPGDPFSEEQMLRQEVHKTLMQHHGLHQSWFVQYTQYIKALLQGDLGYSLKQQGRSVTSMIQEGFAISAWLGLQTFCMALFGGIALGTLAALFAQRWPDYCVLFFTLLGISIPSFILATLLQYTLAIWWPLLPLARWGSFSQTLLPSLALGALPLAFICRLTRNGLLEVLQTDYIKMVRAKGLPLSIWLGRHALRNALLPVLSYSGQLLTNVLVGSFVIEKIFSIPGLGQGFVNSVAARDYPLIMGLTLFYSALLLSLTFCVDLLYSYWDPRIRVVVPSKLLN